MDREKITELHLLFLEKLSGYTTAVLHTESQRVVHFEIKVSFRNDHELDHAIRALQKLNI